MVIMHERWARRIRITSKPDQLIGWHVRIEDVTTGELITNITRAVITLIPGELNAVELSYLAADEETKRPIVLNGDVIERKIKLQFPQVELTALERKSP